MTINTGSSTGGTPAIPFSQENTFALNQVLMFDTTLNAFVNTTLPVGGTTGEINTGSNIGAGQGVFKDKLGADMRFKTIVAGTGIAVTSDTDEVFIATVGAGSGDITGGTSTGSGNAVFRDKSGADLRFRSLTAGTNVTLTQNADDIVVNAGTNALTLNSIADTGYVKVANNLSDITAATARTNLSILSTAEADAKYLHLDTSKVPTADATTSLGTGVKRFNKIYAVSFKGNADTATTATAMAGFTPGDYLIRAGGTMTGAITLSGAPTNALHAASKGYVDTSLADAIDTAPGALDTLNELAAALGDDANFSTTITNLIGTKLPLAGGTLTGALVLSGAPTIALHSATKAYVDAGDALQLTAASNLSDIGNAATARTNLGLGTAATTASGAYLAAGTLTTGVAEGTNKYYTDARVMAVIGGINTANLSEGTNLYFTTARAKAAAVADAIANAVVDVAPSQNAVFDALALKEGTLTAGTTAQYYRGDKSWQTLNTSVVVEGTNLYFTNARADARITAASITSHTNVDSAGASEDGKVLYYNHGTTQFKWKTDASTPAGYNNANWNTAFGWGDHGVVGYLTSIAADSILDTHIDWGTGANQVSTADIPEATNLYYTDARADARIVAAGSANWNTAFGWGNHGAAGYLTAITAQSLTSLSNVAAVVAGDDGKVLYYDHGTTSFKWKADDDVPAGYNNANWDTAFGWGNHASGGYLTAQTSHADVVQDGDFTSQGIMLRGGSAGSYSILADASANWNTAFGWGNHASGGYLTSIAVNSINDTHIDWGTGANQVSTADIPEATNLYFTNARADGRITAAVGTSVQAYDADLTAIGALAKTDGNFIVGNGSAWVAEDAATARASLGLGTMATALTSIYYTKTETDARFANVVGTGANLADLADASAARTNLGLGTAAVANTTAFPDLLLSNLSNTATARTNLGTIGLPEGDARYVRLDVNYLPTADNTVVLGDTTKRFNTIYARQFKGQMAGTFDATMNTDDLLEGSTNLYYTDARADARITAADTDDLSEGSTNLYFTNARADARITAALIDEDNMATNSATRLPSQQSVKAYVDAQAHYSSFNADFDTRIATKTTAHLAEGANLYYTDARADARVGAAALSALSNVHTAAATDGQVLKWVNANSRWEPGSDAGHATTSTLTEGTNLYYTDARVDTRVGTKSVDIFADVDTTSAAPTANQVLTWDAAGSKWVPATAPGAGGTGEVNDGANVGTAGEEIYHGKTGNTLQFRKLNSLDANLTIVADVGNSKIDFNLGGDIMLGANNLNDVASATTTKTNLGIGTTDSPTFGGVGTGSVTITATPTSGPAAAPTFSGTIFKSLPVASGSGHKWVIGTEQDGDYDFSYFTINDAGANTSSSETYMHFDPTGTKYVSIGSASIQTWLSGLLYPQVDGTANQVLKTDGAGNLGWTTVSGGGVTTLTALTDVDAVVAGDNAKILYYNHATTSFKWKVDAGGIALTDLSVTTAAAGTAALAYNSGTGVFTYTPPNLSSYLTSETSHADVVQDGDFASQGIMLRGGSAGSYSILADASANWNTAYGWGNHASGGYLTSIAANSINDTHIDWGTGANQVSTADIPEATNLYYTDARADARAQLKIDAIIDSAPGALDTLNELAASLGDDANFAGTMTTALGGKEPTVAAGTTAQYYKGNKSWATLDTAVVVENTNLYYTDARADARITNAGSANWNTAFGWGDHGAAGYITATLTDEQVQDKVGAMFSGNTETLITATYQDSTGDIDLVVDNNLANYSNASSGFLTSIAANSINDTHIDWGTGANQVSTADIPENTNLYFTNARADARIWAFMIDEDDMVSNSAVKQPTQQSVKAYVDAQAHYTNANADARIALANLSDLVDVHTTAPTAGQILAWDNGNSRYEPTTVGGTGTVTSIIASTGLTGGTITTTGTVAVDVGTTANKIVQLDGSARLPAVDGSQLTNISHVPAANAINDTHIDWGTGSNQVSTADIPEATNLYYTDARAQAISINNLVEDTTPQLGGTLDANGNTIDMGTNVITDAKVGNYDTAVATMPNWNLAYTHSIAAHAPSGAEVNQNAFTTIAVSGQSNVVADTKTDTLTLVAGSNMTITTAAGSDTITLASSGGGIALTDLSVTTAAAGTAALAYNNGSGVFTYTPPNLSTYLTSTGVLSSHTDVHTAAPSTSDVLTWVASQSRWEPAAPQFTGFSGLTEEVVDTAADKIAFLDADNVTKKESIADFLTAIAGTNLTAASGQLNASGGGGGGDTFKTIAVSGQSDVVADATTDTLTLVAGSNVTLTTNAGADSITIAASGGGGGTVDYEEFKCNYHTDGSLLAATNISSGISSVTIDSAAGGDVTVNFTGYTTPPIGIMFYGYGYASNVYNMNTLGSTGTTLRELPGGGSSGSPTAFGSFANLKIRIREAETGASRTFGSTTHAWIRFVMGA